MGSRFELQDSLEALMSELGLSDDEVYFQPPASVSMSYPAIVYRLSSIDLKWSNDKIYLGHKAYEITIIDKNPDSNIPDAFLHKYPLCRFNRFFISENLNHWLFILYF